MISLNDQHGLKKQGYVLKSYPETSNNIRVFSFIELDSKFANSSRPLFDGLYSMLTRKPTVSLIKSGQIYEVVATNHELNTKIVIEYEVGTYLKIFDVLSKIIKYCNEGGFECGFKTFLEFKYNSVQMCDDGEFLSKIMHE